MFDRIRRMISNIKKRSKIPRGYYCHDSKDRNKICPYWRLDAIHIEEQENGYCEYLEKSDWDLNEEEGDIEWTKSDGEKFVTPAHDMVVSLLWDKVKECNKR